MSVPALDPYAVLGIERDATADDIKAAFKRKAKLHHPDAGGDAATFERVNWAHQLLKDAARRKKFDDTGDASEQMPSNADAAAVGFISQVISQILQQPDDPFQHDLAAAIVSVLEKKLSETAKEEVALRKSKARAEKMVGRFKRKAHRRKGDERSDNVLDGMVKWHLDMIMQALAGLVRLRKDLTRAIEIANDHSFTTDSPYLTHGFQSSTAASGSSSFFRLGGFT